MGLVSLPPALHALKIIISFDCFGGTAASRDWMYALSDGNGVGLVGVG